MDENDILLTTVTVRRYLGEDGDEYMSVDTEPQASVAEAVGMLAMASHHLMANTDE